mmetsp:Transcript_15875/g.50905  ORF Transcript_15875/g.50905 Transcript_15875/m.50905 type:complete len:92 (-) Transcript_15875:1788-2063(-)
MHGNPEHRREKGAVRGSDELTTYHRVKLSPNFRRWNFLPDAVSTTPSPREAKSDTPEEPPPEEVTRKSAEGGPVLASPGALAYPQQASGAA